MSGRRREPFWRVLVTFAVVAALVALAVAFAVRLFSGTMALVRADGGASERDPQFAEPTEAVTRPPELAGEGEAPALADDPSAGWDLGVQTPVDKTAEELAREAQAGG